MDYKIYKLTNGRIIQIASKEKMQKWSGEEPIVYINYILNNQLGTYGSNANQKEISQYLDEALTEIAIPKLIQALDSSPDEELLGTLTRIEELSRKSPDLVKVTLTQVAGKVNHPDNEISKLAVKIHKNYDRAMKRREVRKKLAENEKIGGSDAELDRKLINGEINEIEYIRLKKERIQAYQELEEV